ncbi:MAG: dipicolinate synthase subunit DpsA [Clostridia bacterium]|nr:dipicolinate synthase subunit DpsA [Clostridia bacterium]
MVKNTVCVIGGDLRQKRLCELLLKDGYTVKTIGLFEDDSDLSPLKSADIAVFPMPMSFDNVYINAPFSKKQIAMHSVLEALPDGCFVLGGRISKETEDALTKRGLKFADYYKREELIVKNAIPTAEGALEIAFSELPITIFGSKSLVIGYGRVGKVMAKKLRALESDVTVSARKYADFAWIEEGGMNAIHTEDLPVFAGNFDLIINTVPAMILTEEVLKRVRDDALIIDLASKPGGVDFGSAKRLSRNVIWALSLPGKTSPVTSGEIIKEAITNILEETGVLDE